MSGGGGGQERTWIVSFADLLSLMLTFMVMLFSMSDSASAPRSPPPPAMPPAAPSRTDSLAETLDWTGREMPTAAARFSAERMDPPPALALGYLGGILTAMIEREPLLSGARVVRREDRLVLAIPASLLFASGSASPTEAARKALQALTPTLQGIGNRLGVEGRTDPQAVGTGSAFASNWELSLSRAVAVAGVLQEAGLRRTPTVYGLAETQPDELGDTSSDGHGAIDRRVDLVFFASTGDER